MTIEERKGVTVAQVASLHPEISYQVVPDIQIEGCTFQPEKVGIPRNEDGTWEIKHNTDRIQTVDVADGTFEPTEETVESIKKTFVPPPVQPENTLDRTVRNPVWIAENREKLRELFPETYTHPANINFLRIRFHLKLYGIDYRSEPEFIDCLVELNKANIIKTDGFLIRRGYP